MKEIVKNYTETLNATCENNQLIYVHTAFFGKFITDHFDEESYPDVCYQNETYDIVKGICEGKNQCNITVSLNIFKDPCFGFPKKLYFQYFCTDNETINMLNKCPKQNYIKPYEPCPKINDQAVKDQYFLNNQNFSILCDQQLNIKIICAFFGYDTYYNKIPIQNYQYPAAALYNVNYVTKQLKNFCENNSSCSITLSSGQWLSTHLMNNYGYYDRSYYFLQVQWTCNL